MKWENLDDKNFGKVAKNLAIFTGVIFIIYLGVLILHMASVIVYLNY